MSGKMWGYTLLGVAGIMLNQLAVELGAGRVPVPEDWRWLIAVGNVGIVALAASLPKVRAGRRRSAPSPSEDAVPSGE